jgi:hypothetical protein
MFLLSISFSKSKEIKIKQINQNVFWRGIWCVVNAYLQFACFFIKRFEFLFHSFQLIHRKRTVDCASHIQYSHFTYSNSIKNVRNGKLSFDYEYVLVLLGFVQAFLFFEQLFVLFFKSIDLL